MKIIVTGGCGFVGSNTCRYLKQKYPDYQIIAFDNLVRKGSSYHITSLKEYGVQVVKGDVRNFAELAALGGFDVLIDAAAEPSVQAGMDDQPDYVIETNLIGTLNCLKLVQRHNARLLFLSTSRVYPYQKLNAIPFKEGQTRFEFDSNEMEGFSLQGITEQFPLSGPKSYYGASKLASEMFIEEYRTFHGVQAMINRCGVIAGPGQMGKIDQGIVCFWLKVHLWKQPLAYIGYGGEGKQVRDILHIADLVELLDKQIHEWPGFTQLIYQVGGGMDRTISLQELTQLCQAVTGNNLDLRSQSETRRADVRIYYGDNQLLYGDTDWRPHRSVAKSVEDTFNWIQSDMGNLRKVLL